MKTPAKNLALAEQHVATMATICRLIDQSDEIPKLDALAARAGFSSYYFHRLFKTITGLTPQGYAAAHRAKRIRVGLARGDSVTVAIFDAGYNSNSHFYEKSGALLGMTPSNYRAGGANTEICFAIGQCSLGALLVATSDKGVCAILMGDNPDALVRDLQDRFPKSSPIGGDTKLEELVAKVIGFVEAPAIGLALALDIRGTAFQQRVWQALREIPSGLTASYTDIAHKIGAPKALRAVAGACAANMLAIAIPCHRVVRLDGGLSDYRWGVERKRALLEREAQAADDGDGI